MEKKQRILDNNLLEKQNIIKLEDNKTLADLEIDKLYLGTIKNNKLFLNKNISASISADIKAKNLIVKIKKIILPNSFEYELYRFKKSFDSITEQDIGKKYWFNARVQDIKQTSGPTVFNLFDGTGYLRSVSFSKAGERSHPEINVNDYVNVLLEIKQRDSTIESEILSIKKLSQEKTESLKQNFINILKNKSMPVSTDFLIKSEKLEHMKPRFIEMASIIRQAILEQRPILIKHHADCDGYSAAIALERAILPLIINEHKSEKAAWQFYKRTPSKAPFYEYLDATKDISFFTGDTDKFGVKEPLIILADNGSTHEDILSIKKVKIYGAHVVVIDHHDPGKIINGRAEVDEYLDCHINPHLFGYDSNITAGMLCTELARFINPDVKNIEFLPALAGITDKSECEEFNNYLKISNRSREFLEKLGACVDFEAHYLKFTEGRGLVDVLFGKNKEKQEKLVNLLYKDIKERFDKQLLVVKEYSKIINFNNFQLLTLDLEKTTIRSEFPAAGKTLGLAHDYFKAKTTKGFISLGFGSDFIVFRCDGVSNFDVNDIVEYIKNKIPHSLADGGGHAFAGSLKFISGSKELIIDDVLDYIKKLDTN